MFFYIKNQDDIEGHIELNQKAKGPFLKKYRLKSSERSKVIHELRYMNINHMQLFPTIEGACRKVTNDVALIFPMGKTKSAIKQQALIKALTDLSGKKKE